MVFESAYLVTLKGGNILQCLCCILKLKQLTKKPSILFWRKSNFMILHIIKKVFLLIQNMKYYWVLYLITYIWRDSKLWKENLCHQRCVVPTQHHGVSCKITSLLAGCAARNWQHCIYSVPAVISPCVTDSYIAVCDLPCPPQDTGVQPQVKVRKPLDRVSTTL